MKVRHANGDDLAWLLEHDRHVDDAWTSRCIAADEYLICEVAGTRAGFMRHSLFWGTIPYMDMIFVLQRYRYQGAGTLLLEAWETRMRAAGATILMTSATAGEKAPQAWHRRNGFEESGRLTFGRHDPSPETFFVKDL